jgi:hypothetical protein
LAIRARQPHQLVAFLCFSIGAFVVIPNESAFGAVQFVQKALGAFPVKNIVVDHVADEPNGFFAFGDLDSVSHREIIIQGAWDIASGISVGDNSFNGQLNHRAFADQPQLHEKQPDLYPADDHQAKREQCNKIVGLGTSSMESFLSQRYSRAGIDKWVVHIVAERIAAGHNRNWGSRSAAEDNSVADIPDSN